MSFPPLPHRPRWQQWLALALCAGLAGSLLHLAGFPAAYFLGAMFVAIGFGVAGAGIRVHRSGFQFAQGLVGTLVAHSITAPVVVEIIEEWPIMLIATLVTVVLSLVSGLILAKTRVLPGTSAIWGTAPGAASAMVAMADDYGADARLVATMQYVRVVCVVASAAIIGHLLGASGSTGGSMGPLILPPPGRGLDMLLSLAVVGIGIFLGRRIPAGAMLCPLLLGAVLQATGLLDIILPGALLILAYGLIGCFVGLRFDRRTLRYVVSALPGMLTAAILLIALCALSALLFALWLDRDYLSLYLATSPGGLDSVSIIAVETQADVGLVVALQTLRLFGVILTGPFLAKWCVRLLER